MSYIIPNFPFYAIAVFPTDMVAIIGAGAMFIDLNGATTLAVSIKTVKMPAADQAANFVSLRSAFQNCSSLTNITIPDSVTDIEWQAFSKCISLKSVVISKSVLHFGGDIFEDTPWFENLPDGPIYLNQCFYKYKGEMPTDFHVDIKEGTTTICDFAFLDCKNLKFFHQILHSKHYKVLYLMEMPSGTYRHAFYQGREHFVRNIPKQVLPQDNNVRCHAKRLHSMPFL